MDSSSGTSSRIGGRSNKRKSSDGQNINKKFIKNTEINENYNKNHEINELEDPEIVGCFSTCQNEFYENDMHNLKYLKITNEKRNEGFNLECNLEANTTNHDYLDRMKVLTKFIMKNEQQVINGKPFKADFVCFRGVLKYVMQSLYNREKWGVEATKFRGTIYLAIVVDSTKESTYDVGFKFEHYVLSTSPNKEPKGKNATRRSEDFCIVMKRKIGENTVLFGAECDGVESKEVVKDINDLKKSKLIEVKTRIKKSWHDSSNYKDYSHFAWWCQSYIAGIKEIEVGNVLEDKYTVEKIEKFKTEQFEKKSEGQKFWSKSQCLTFLNEFFKKIKEDMKNVDDNQIVFVYTTKTITKYDKAKNKEKFETELSQTKHNKFTPEEIKQKIRDKIEKIQKEGNIFSEEYINFINNRNQ